mmetsp:Transcript_48368/g.90589  ORF Transcript_48368/g.90589 Transcript_48368/m.90589 type:complete len:254 (-) Transcript_48368:181-942(-)
MQPMAIEDKMSGKLGRQNTLTRRSKSKQSRKSKSQPPAPLDPSPVNEPRSINPNIISMADSGAQYKNYIHVTEEDLKRYGHDLDKLRARQVLPWSQERRARQLSFGESFEVGCRQPTEVLDPWRNIPDPESFRPPNEGDLFLNQVVPQSPRKLEEEPEETEAEEPIQELLEVQRRSSSKQSMTKEAQGYRRMSSNISAGSASTVASASVSREVSRASSKESVGRNGLQRQSSVPLPPVSRSRSLMLAGAVLAG